MTDLTSHFIAGFLIGFMILMLKKPLQARRPDWLVLLAVGASLAIGVAKEAADKFLGWGTPEVADITLTWMGGTVALVAVALWDWIRFSRSLDRVERRFLGEGALNRILVYSGTSAALVIINIILI
jgi:hypothetical protein